MITLNNFTYSTRMLKGTAVAIGIFDGIHKGHRRLISAALKKAKKNKLKSAILTFDPHPREVAGYPERVKRITSFENNKNILEELGIDFYAVIHTTKAFMKQEGEFFIKEILSKKMDAREVFVGKNFRFGRGKKYDALFLLSQAKAYGMRVYPIECSVYQKEIISSTRIRQDIMKGELLKAEKMLSRPIEISGKVVKGHAKGRSLGFPTANIHLDYIVHPPEGVYAVRVYIEKSWKKGMLNIGKRPVFKSKGTIKTYEKQLTFEVHIFNFKSDIYGKRIRIQFVKRLRNTRSFKNKDALIDQLNNDKYMSIKYLGRK